MRKVAFSPDCTTVASGSSDKTLRLWGAGDGLTIGKLEHDGAVRGVAFSPDGSTLATASEDLSVRLWRVSDGTLISKATNRGVAIRLYRTRRK